MRNRFKGLDLIDRVPDELWMKVRDIVQETGIKTIQKKKECKKKKPKWLSEEALQIAVKRREAKSKGEKKRYSHLFQNFPQFIVIHTVKGFGIVNKQDQELTVAQTMKSLLPNLDLN